MRVACSHRLASSHARSSLHRQSQRDAGRLGEDPGKTERVRSRYSRGGKHASLGWLFSKTLRCRMGVIDATVATVEGLLPTLPGTSHVHSLIACPQPPQNCRSCSWLFPYPVHSVRIQSIWNRLPSGETARSNAWASGNVRAEDSASAPAARSGTPGRLRWPGPLRRRSAARATCIQQDRVLPETQCRPVSVDEQRVPRARRRPPPAQVGVGLHRPIAPSPMMISSPAPSRSPFLPVI
jgi:hypothetical protein